MLRRLWFPPLAALAAVMLMLAGPGFLLADGELERSRLVNKETLAAVESGFRFLRRTQNANGSWTSNAGKKINTWYRPFQNGTDVQHVGVTSLAVLAFLAGGHQPGRGPYGETLDKAIGYVLDQVTPTGCIAANRTRMYSHAFATLALAEVYGVTKSHRVRTKLEKAVEFTVSSQSKAGGWRYTPFTADSDMSVTVCQVTALRAAQSAGLKVPRSTIDRARRYVIESANTGQNGYPRGSFLYQPQKMTYNRESFALTAAGLTTLFQAGLYTDKALARYVEAHRIEKSGMRIEDVVRYMHDTYADVSRRYREHYFYYYGNYYAMQAMYHVGLKRPKLWAAWYRRVRDDLMAKRTTTPRRPGRGREVHWESNIDTTHAYATASALLILQFPLDQLPIHQR